MDQLMEVRKQIHRYFVAVHGKDYIYRAPETFPNRVERWMLAVLRGDDDGIEAAENQIALIEEHFEEQRAYDAGG